MSTNEVFMIPDNRGGQNSFDPNLLLASMMNDMNLVCAVKNMMTISVMKLVVVVVEDDINLIILIGEENNLLSF